MRAWLLLTVINTCAMIRNLCETYLSDCYCEESRYCSHEREGLYEGISLNF